MVMSSSNDKRKRDKKKFQFRSAKEWAEQQEERGFTPTTIKLPEGVTLFNPKKAGRYRIDVLPFIAGEGNPNCDAGTPHFERTFYIHRGIGVNEDSFVCPAKTWGKKCPICREMRRLQTNGDLDDDTRKEMKPQVRQLWVVRDHTSSEKFQIWDSAYFNSFGEMIKDKVDASDDEDGYDQFYFPQGGKTLKLSFKDDTFKGRSFAKLSNIEFVDRKKDYSEDITEETPCLDEILKEVDYDELKRIFLQEDEEDEDGGKKGPKSKAKKPKGKPKDDEDEDEDEEDEEEDSDDEDEEEDSDDEDEEDEDDDSDKEDEDDEDEDSEGEVEEGSKVVHEEHGLCTITKISGDGTSLTLKDKKGKIHKAISPDEVEIHKEDEDEDDEDEDEDEEEDEEEQERPAPKKKTRGKK